MGEKEKARQAMKKAKVPILPGSDGMMAERGRSPGVGEKGRLSGHPQSQGRRRRARHAHCAHRGRAAQPLSRRAH